MISPFDPKSIPEIEHAINAANIGINPVNDGKVIRLQIPQVTEERRKELTKVVKKMGEDTKVAVRNLRRDANDKVKKMEKAGDFTEDDAKGTLDDIQKLIDKTIKDIDKIVEEKMCIRDRFYGVDRDMVMAGNGSDEVLAFLFMAFQQKSGRFYFPEISYSFYPVYCSVFGAEAVKVPLKEDFSIDPSDYYGVDGTIIITNPNAPTGIALAPVSYTHLVV